MCPVPALFLAVSLSAVAHATPVGPSQLLPYTVTNGLTKVRPGMELPPRAQAHLTAARGECEGFQVRVAPPAEQVRATGMPLQGTRGGVDVRLYREGFIPVIIPTLRNGPTGLFPDPLLPVVDPAGHPLKGALPWDSTKEAPLVLYAEVCVPAGTAPGPYRGAVALEAAGGRRASVPVNLEVEPFAIPATSSLPNTFGISLYSIAKGHGLAPQSHAAQRLLRAYATMMLEHRLSAHGMGLEPPPARFKDGKPLLDFRAYDEEMEDFLSGRALPSGARFTTADLREHPRIQSPEERIAYDRAFREHFEERNWRQVLFFYAKDEPKKEDRALVLLQAERVHRAKGIPVLVTSAFDSVLQPATDIYCPVLNCFFPRRGPSTCSKPLTVAELKSRIPSTARVYWYQSCMSHGCEPSDVRDPKLEPAFKGWASYMVDASGPLNRAMGPLAFRAGVQGELYFDVVSAYNDTDPWVDVLKFGGNGDGTLFYPGTPARLGGTDHLPVASLRLKNIRDGLEDYEYLKLLEHLGERELAYREAKKLARSGYEITDNPEAWEQVRTELTERLRAKLGTHAQAKGDPP